VREVGRVLPVSARCEELADVLLAVRQIEPRAYLGLQAVTLGELRAGRSVVLACDEGATLLEELGCLRRGSRLRSRGHRQQHEEGRAEEGSLAHGVILSPGGSTQRAPYGSGFGGGRAGTGGLGRGAGAALRGTVAVAVTGGLGAAGVLPKAVPLGADAVSTTEADGGGGASFVADGGDADGPDVATADGVDDVVILKPIPTMAKTTSVAADTAAMGHLLRTVRGEGAPVLVGGAVMASCRGGLTGAPSCVSAVEEGEKAPVRDGPKPSPASVGESGSATP